MISIMRHWNRLPGEAVGAPIPVQDYDGEGFRQPDLVKKNVWGSLTR